MMSSTRQHTLGHAVTVSGVGVHSGAAARLTLAPAPVNSGITFIRSDVTDRDNIVPARFDTVADTRLCTVIANAAGVTVATIEHVMAALAACGIDNVLLDIDGPEMPIMDGSSAPFMQAIEQAGIVAQNAARRVLMVKKTVTYTEGDKEVVLSPADGQYFGFEIAFPSAAIGQQKYTHLLKMESFKKDIASCRTFGFLHEVEALRKIGLARGGSLDNAIVVDGDKVLNPEGLRFKNEFVRHKILDAVGDIYLAGGQLIGHYHGVKAGHALNNKILHVLFADPTAYEWVELKGEKPAATAPAATTAIPVYA